jgi:hypothetical protein
MENVNKRSWFMDYPLTAQFLFTILITIAWAFKIEYNQEMIGLIPTIILGIVFIEYVEKCGYGQIKSLLLASLSLMISLFLSPFIYWLYF